MTENELNQIDRDTLAAISLDGPRGRWIPTHKVLAAMAEKVPFDEFRRLEELGYVISSFKGPECYFTVKLTALAREALNRLAPAGGDKD